MKEVILAWISPFRPYEDNRVQAVITFWNKEKYDEFLNAKNKRHWLMEELNKKEEYFWNTAIFLSEEEYKEWAGIDDDYNLEKKYKDTEYINIK